MAELHTGKIGAAPRPTRNKARALESSDIWLQTRAKLASGLTPYEEFWISFTPDDKEKYQLKNPARTFKALVMETLRKLNMHYDVDRYLSGGSEVVKISNPVISKRELEVQEQVVHRSAGKKKRA